MQEHTHDNQRHKQTGAYLSPATKSLKLDGCSPGAHPFHEGPDLSYFLFCHPDHGGLAFMLFGLRCQDVCGSLSYQTHIEEEMSCINPVYSFPSLGQRFLKEAQLIDTYFPCAVLGHMVNPGCQGPGKSTSFPINRAGNA